MTSNKKPTYKSLDQRSHVLLRPDMYIGTVKNIMSDFYGAKYVSNKENVDIDDNEDNHDIEEKKITVEDSDDEDTKDKSISIFREKGLVNSGLHRIFIEILSNAIDNSWRSSSTDTKCTKIKIDIDEKGYITVWNDGMTIPIEIDKDSELYNPELIFGKLLTSSNYDDNEERFTSGRNGLGSKATNIFSKEFGVKIFHPESGKQYVQTWKNNMSEKDSPKITTPKQKNGYTQISFLPDYEKFGVKNLSDEMKSLFFKNVVDTAMITGISVFFNGKKIPVKTLKDYAALYYPKDIKDIKDIVCIESKDCQVVFSPNQKGDMFSQVSFVNGIETFKGGVHVDDWTDNVLRPVLEKINSGVKKGSNPLSMRDIKPYFRIFINAKLANPSFDSQEKSYLTSPHVSDPEKYLQTKHINAILKWDIINNIKDLLKSREMTALKKIEKKRGYTKIEGLDQANLAGSKHSDECSLILCEGDSAKTFAVKGIQTGVSGKKGRDYFGIYPLKGKCLNVRNSNVTAITKNKEIRDIIQALNLKYGTDYTKDDSYDSLSYGRVIILTDSDVDGYHICGLLLNFFHNQFPSLLQRNPSFISCMRTPIVRVYYPKTDISFYTLEDFKKYQKNNQNKKGDIKYFKGLGTNNDKEIETSFGKKMIDFVKDDQTDQNMDKVFHSKFSDQRKKWLEEYNPSSEIEIVSKDPLQKLPISDFLNNEMIKFSIDDCKRSIPSIMDGLKESHRKILYAIFLKNLNYNSKTTLKVAQLAGFVAEKTNYHHGEQCLFDTITKMAHNFVGSNNIPLLYRDGQFGSRLEGGKDAADGRYIKTKLDMYTRMLFRKEDDVLLTHIQDDGDKVEPIYFVPILPMILVNGCTAGIGTGWSSNVPCYNPLDIVKEIKGWIDHNFSKDEDEKSPYSFRELTPWYKGFKGAIEKISKNKYTTKGIMERKSFRNTMKTIVTELPISMWTNKFKEYIEELIECKDIKSFKNYSTVESVNFEIDDSKDGNECNEEMLKLTSSLSSNNMVLFNSKGEIKKYDDVSSILEEFCQVRFEFYVKRKEYILKELERLVKISKNKQRFLKEVMNEELIIKDVDEDELCKEMEKRKYDGMENADNMDNIQDDMIGDDKIKKYRYLLNMNIRSFTKQKLEILEKEVDKLEKEFNRVKNIKPSQMWMDDLEDFEKEYK